MTRYKINLHDRFGRKVGSATAYDPDENVGMWVFFGVCAVVLVLIVGLVWGGYYVVNGVHHWATQGQFVQDDKDLQGLPPQTTVSKVVYKGLPPNAYGNPMPRFRATITNSSGQPHHVDWKGIPRARVHTKYGTETFTFDCTDAEAEVPPHSKVAVEWQPCHEASYVDDGEIVEVLVWPKVDGIY
jgi:uncharacterized iron-regulated membrane protein